MASVTFTNARDHGVVILNGELDWGAALALVDAIGACAPDGFYDEIDLVVTTPADVLHIGPGSTLAPGECHPALSDGHFEHRQLEPSAGVRPEP